MLKEVAGSDRNFRLDEFTETMRSRIVSIFSDALASAKIPVLDVATRYQEVGEALLPLINPIIQAKYGIELASFVLENVSVPAEVEQAIDKRSSMAAVGNLNDYVKFQMAQGMEKGGSAGGVATEMAVGLAMAQQIMQQQNTHAIDRALRKSGHCRGGLASGAAAIPELAHARAGRGSAGRKRSGCDAKPGERRVERERRSAPVIAITRAALNEFLKELDMAELTAHGDVSHVPRAAARRNGHPPKQALVCPFCGTVSPMQPGAAAERRGQRARSR